MFETFASLNRWSALNVVAAANTGGAAAAVVNIKKLHKDGRNSTASCRLFGRCGPGLFAILVRVAKIAAGTGAAGQPSLHEERHAEHLHVAVVCVEVPVQAQFMGKAVLVGLSVPTDDLLPLVGHSD